MLIRLVKCTNNLHRLEINRDDSSKEAVELDTRAYLLHDLVHYAVEIEAPITDGFWGLLDEGYTLAELSDRCMKTPLSMGLARAERLVGPMLAVWNGSLDVSLYIENTRTIAPDLVTREFVDRVHSRLRGLWSLWRATPYRHTIELPWSRQLRVAAQASAPRSSLRA